ncbi:MAG: hypothetical protein HY368_00130 [Candidatus Aenigmarchaeota archaeon]|nr:hypothetical protein [Candidatus Aenigmarchaeota archaeon]
MVKGLAFVAAVVLFLVVSGVGFVILQSQSCSADLNSSLKELRERVSYLDKNLDAADTGMQNIISSVKRHHQEAEQFYKANKCSEASQSIKAANDEDQHLSAYITKKLASDISERTSGSVGCASSDFIIESVSLDTTANVGRVTVRNRGGTDENVVSAKMFNKEGEESPSITIFPKKIPRGSLTALNFDIRNTVICESFSNAIVTTECATEIFDSKPDNC